jgi:hypothetical protein
VYDPAGSLVVKVNVVPFLRPASDTVAQLGTMSNVPTPAIVTSTEHGLRDLASW